MGGHFLIGKLCLSDSVKTHFLQSQQYFEFKHLFSDRTIKTLIDRQTDRIPVGKAASGEA